MNILETYVLTAPIFYFGKTVKTIGDSSDEYGIDVPIPHAFVKSVLAEDERGRLSLWTFEMENKRLSGKLEDYLVSTYDAEQLVGGRFWDRISGGDIHEQREKPDKDVELQHLITVDSILISRSQFLSILFSC